MRPVSVRIGLLGTPVSREQRLFISWFGIRGIGSIYYLMYAINQGLPRHGISVTPLMNLYGRRKARRSGR
ncbi:MAG: Na+/H+ antiporter [bacterium]|nr:MAG: Na+/H+ antiporter [bacterium]